MFDESSGWSESSENLEKLNGVPVLKLQVDFSPKAFNEWHKSLFTGELNITVENCAKVYKICDYYNEESLLPKIESFMAKNMTKLNPFEIFDLSKNLNAECIERMKSYHGRISEKNIRKIRKMKLESFKDLYRAFMLMIN